MTLQVHVCEVQGHLLSSRQADHINTLSVVGVVVGPVGGDDDSLTVSEGTTTPRVTWKSQLDEKCTCPGQDTTERTTF